MESEHGDSEQSERPQGDDADALRGAPALAAIEGMVRTFALNDIEGFLDHLTEDVILEPPPFLLGKRRYEGRDGLRAGFAELDRTIGPDKRVRVWPRRYFLDRADPDKLLVLVAITVTQLDSSEYGAEATLLLKMRGDKVCEYTVPPSWDDGLACLDDPVEIEP